MTSYSEKHNRRFRRMFTVALFMGLLAGFLIGRLTYAIDIIPPETPVEQSLAASVALPIPDPIPIPAPVEPVRTLLGTYRVTAYCACEKCCGKWASNRPNGVVYGAAGVELQAGVSCASPLPFGTVIEIEGLGEYTVQDRTATWVVEKYGENLIDIYLDDHDAACNFGLKQLNVYLKEEPKND